MNRKIKIVMSMFQKKRKSNPRRNKSKNKISRNKISRNKISRNKKSKSKLVLLIKNKINRIPKGKL